MDPRRGRGGDALAAPPPLARVLTRTGLAPSVAATRVAARLRGTSPRTAILAILLVAAVLRLPTLTAHLTETHAFRQTQTAFTAAIFASEGIDLLHPMVPVLGSPWVIPFEFPVVQAVAAIPIRLGLSAEVSLRGVSLAAFLASGYLLWLILATWVNPRTALIATVVFAWSPIAILFSRAALIEYPAVLGALLFLYGSLKWQDSGHVRWLLLSAVSGIAVAMVKVTTAVFWLAPALLLRRWALVAIVGVSGLSALVWTRYADAVKAANPYTAFLTSERLLGWNFGGDRLDPSVWLAVLTRSS